MEDINAIIAKSKHDIPRLHNYVEFIVSTLSDVIHNEGESESDFIIKTNKSGQKARSVIFKSGETIDFAARPYQLLTLTQRDAAGSIWDHAGRRTKGRFVTNLQMQGSYEPRAAEPGVEAARPAVEIEVIAIVDKVMKKTNTKLRVRRGD